MYTASPLFPPSLSHHPYSLLFSLPHQVDHSSGLDHLVLEADHPPPTEDEQQQMAMFWAMEEANTPRGWDDEEELDYTMVSQRQAMQLQSGASPDRDKSTGNLSAMHNNSNVLGVDDGVVNQTMYVVGVAMYNYMGCNN